MQKIEIYYDRLAELCSQNQRLKTLVRGTSLTSNFADLKASMRGELQDEEIRYVAEVYVKDISFADEVKQLLPKDLYNCLHITTMPVAYEGPVCLKPRSPSRKSFFSCF